MQKTPSADSAGRKIKWPDTVAVFIVTVLVIAGLYYWSAVPVLYRIVLALMAVVISGELLIRRNGFARLTSGLYMARSRLGLKRMDELSRRHPEFWNAMADWGLVMGFGLLSIVLFKKDLSKKSVVFGAISIAFILIVIVPQTLLAFPFLNIPGITSRLQGIGFAPSISQLTPQTAVLYGLSVVSGMVFYIIALLAINAGGVLYGIILALIGLINTGTANYAAVSNSIPGVAPVIPGLTIPLVAGILAFAVVIIPHEFSHGILARISKIKVKSSGLLMAGIIPIGAFVEPEEDKVAKLKRQAQNRISAAGVSANMLLALMLVVPVLLMYFYVMPHFHQNYIYVAYVVPNSSASSVLAPGDIITMLNGHSVSNLTNFVNAAKADVPNSSISLVTHNTTYTLHTNSTGKVGVGIYQGSRLTGGALGGIASFIYSFLALAFMLSLFVAIVNYLPLPGFDGWRIFYTSIKNKMLVNYIAAFVIIVIVLNVLPWIWIGL